MNHSLQNFRQETCILNYQRYTTPFFIVNYHHYLNNQIFDSNEKEKLNEKKSSLSPLKIQNNLIFQDI